MELVANPVGLLTIIPIIFLFLLLARRTPLGALSLPCVSLLTTLIYFYLMPALASEGGRLFFLGAQIDSLNLVHFAALLYALGVAAASFIWLPVLAINPVSPRPQEIGVNQLVFHLLTGVAIMGLLVMTLTGRLNLAGEQDYIITSDYNQFAFLQLSISMLLPVTLVYVVRSNFGPLAWVLIAAVTIVILTSGFRFRVVVFAIAITICFCLLRGIRMRPGVVIVGASIGIIGVNALGMVRQYGAGLNMDNFEFDSLLGLLSAFSGEIGPIFVLHGVLGNPEPDPIGATPWLVAIARLVPSFLWPDKPFPTYLIDFALSVDKITGLTAGIAGSQHAEMFLQFGWWGLVILPILYLYIIIRIAKLLSSLSWEARIAGAGLLPGLFGFYMQQRGYFFQNLCEALFMIGPLFVMHAGKKRKPQRAHMLVSERSVGGAESVKRRIR